MDLIVVKCIALALFFIIPVVMGSLPLYLRNKLRSPSATKDLFSYLSCFAGGFFLGTCFLVVLGQGLSKFEEYRHHVNLQYGFPFFEVGIGVGFFLVAFTEKLLRLTCVAARHGSSSGGEEDKTVKDEELIRIYKKAPNSYTLSESDHHTYEDVGVPSKEDGGVLPGGTKASTNSKEPLSSERSLQSSPPLGTKHDHDGGSDEDYDAGAGKAGGRPVSPSGVGGERETTKHGAAGCPHCSGKRGESGGGIGDEVSAGSRESGFSFLRVVLLLLALSLHTIFDGLAVGLQTEVKEVTALVVALAIHKSIMSTVLGMELMTVFHSFWRPFLVLLLFSLASPAGVAIGIAVTSTHVHRSAELLTAALLQAVASGVFIYVTCFEILAGDMVARDDRGLLRVLTAVLGFVAIAGIETALAA